MVKVLAGLTGVFLVVVVALFISGREPRPVIRLSLADTGQPTSSLQPSEIHAVQENIPCTKCHESVLRVAVAAVLSPKETLDSYQELIDYIGEKLGRPTQLIQRKTYAEINDLMRSGNLDVAFVCTGAYVEGHDNFGMELLVAPEINGQPVYYSYIIVPQDSPVESFEQLRGKAFAFSDPLSNSGYLSPTYMLAQMGETPDSFFRNYIFTYGHDNSIEAVAQGLVDGAAVDSLVYDYAEAKGSPYTAATKIVQQSPPYPISPVVVPPNLDRRLYEQLRGLFLDMHREERGREILERLMIDRFILFDDSAYDVIRTMQETIRKQRQGS